MAGSYSADLRGRVLATVVAGATPGAAARGRVAVGRSTAYRWAGEARIRKDGGPPSGWAAARSRGSRARWRRRCWGCCGRRTDLTLAECRDRLAAATGVRVHPWTVGRALRRCGWT